MLGAGWLRFPDFPGRTAAPLFGVGLEGRVSGIKNRVGSPQGLYWVVWGYIDFLYTFLYLLGAPLHLRYGNRYVEPTVYRMS